MTAPYVAPRTPLEAALVEAWAAILHIDGIGVHDNFFELGGDSLQATILLNRLQEHLGDALPGHGMLQVQSVDELANYLRQRCSAAVLQKYPDEAILMEVKAADGTSVSSSCAQTVPDAGMEALGGIVSIPRLTRDDETDDLLARLDELPDDVVESLLNNAIADGEDSYE